MRVDYKHISVGVDPDHPEWLGRPLYCVVNRRSKTKIAELLWYEPWRRYVARFDSDSVWSDDCLNDLRVALIGANREAREGVTNE